MKSRGCSNRSNADAAWKPISIETTNQKYEISTILSIARLPTSASWTFPQYRDPSFQLWQHATIFTAKSKRYVGWEARKTFLIFHSIQQLLATVGQVKKDAQKLRLFTNVLCFFFHIATIFERAIVGYHLVVIPCHGKTTALCLFFQMFPYLEKYMSFIAISSQNRKKSAFLLSYVTRRTYIGSTDNQILTTNWRIYYAAIETHDNA